MSADWNLNPETPKGLRGREKFSGGGKSRYVAQGCHAEWDEGRVDQGWRFQHVHPTGVVSDRPRGLSMKCKIELQHLWFDGA